MLPALPPLPYSDIFSPNLPHRYQSSLNSELDSCKLDF